MSDGRVQSSLVLPARLGYLGPVAAYINALAESEGFDSSEISSVQLAVEEIFVNIVKHGFPDTPDASFQLDIEVQSAGLSLVFKVKGIPFAFERLPQYDPATVLSGDFPKGLGLFLARKSVDRIVFQNLGRNGYSIELTKMLGRKRIDRYPGFEAKDNSAELPKESKLGQTNQYTIRSLRPEEAIEVSRCAYRAYGYTYEDYIYYPDQIVEANRTGHMHSLVAVTPGGKIIGHHAIKKANTSDVIGEVGVQFVQPEYRNGGLGGKLTLAILEKGRALGLSGLYTRAVAGHMLSQKMAESRGVGCCAILLGVFPSQVQFKALTGTIQQKMSGVVYWLGLGSARQRRIFPTRELVPQLARIYEGIGVPCSCDTAPGNGSTAGISESSQLILIRDTVLDIATIEVHEYGKDLLRQVRHQLRILCLEQTPVIYLHLNIEHPAAEQFLPGLQEMGFFFSGVLPCGLAGYDALILQYLNNLSIDYESICLHSPSALELLAFIKGRDPVQRELSSGTP